MQKPLSRLEKFLYALCSLDSSELPNPLSRLEVLLKCLVTGEIPPAFEPLSRNEKYLMAISGSYHDELPNPISRGEKLLYKLATGDDSIDDISEVLSRYEELLAYIVENGCLDGPIDVEYVTYVLMSGQNTLYNTKEVPVKNAILKGQTLVNMVPQDKQHIDGISNVNLTEGRLTWSAQSDWLKLYFVVNGKPNSKYIIKYQSINENVGIFCRPETTDPHSGWYENVTALNQIIHTYDVGTFVISLENAIASSDLWVQDFMIIEYQDGMENWDIPYFEGMKSVEMPVLKTTGKNLFDGKWAIGGIGNTNGLNSGGTKNINGVNHISVKPNTAYVASSSQLQNENIVVWYAYDINKKLISYSTSSRFFTTPSNCEFIRVRTFDGDSANISLDCVLQIEEGSVATEYEPYKSTTVTCDEEVELRGVGDVKDELNLLTGELIRRIDESGNILSQEITESIDLSVVDQDGNGTKLSSFEDITYVTVTSEGILPDVELEVATKNEEVLNTMSLKMDDIYATQTTLEETSNAQSENVDATMMATTEIYEGLL